MKIRMISVMLIFAVAAWLPLMAQQAAPQTGAAQAQEKNACACCEHMKDGKDASKEMACCQGKDSSCCKKDGKGNQSAMNCCAGKDSAQCPKDGKDCCGKDAKQGCCHNAAASDGKDGKQCCAGHRCCEHNGSQS
jgi:hypothetical protein